MPHMGPLVSSRPDRQAWRSWLGSHGGQQAAGAGHRGGPGLFPGAEVATHTPVSPPPESPRHGVSRASGQPSSGSPAGRSKCKRHQLTARPRDRETAHRPAHEPSSRPGRRPPRRSRGLWVRVPLTWANPGTWPPWGPRTCRPPSPPPGKEAQQMAWKRTQRGPEVTSRKGQTTSPSLQPQGQRRGGGGAAPRGGDRPPASAPWMHRSRIARHPQSPLTAAPHPDLAGAGPLSRAAPSPAQPQPRIH